MLERVLKDLPPPGEPQDPSPSTSPSPTPPPTPSPPPSLSSEGTLPEGAAAIPGGGNEGSSSDISMVSIGSDNACGSTASSVPDIQKNGSKEYVKNDGKHATKKTRTKRSAKDVHASPPSKVDKSLSSDESVLSANIYETMPPLEEFENDQGVVSQRSAGVGTENDQYATGSRRNIVEGEMSSLEDVLQNEFVPFSAEPFSADTQNFSIPAGISSLEESVGGAEGFSPTADPLSEAAKATGAIPKVNLKKKKKRRARTRRDASSTDNLDIGSVGNRPHSVGSYNVQRLVPENVEGTSYDADTLSEYAAKAISSCHGDMSTIDSCSDVAAEDMLPIEESDIDVQEVLFQSIEGGEYIPTIADPQSNDPDEAL